jgi:hypothetical protein
MAIYAVGAFYEEDGDVSKSFIENNIVGVGWDQDSAPELHEYLKSLKVGDIVYIKAAFGGADITVKAIGIITDNVLLTPKDMHELASIGRNVKWVSKKKFVIPKPTEKNNVRNNTIYEEFHPEVQKEIIARF